jgi:RNA recognition motif-containing protein
MTEVSSTRLYLGNLPRNATKADVEAHFATHGTGEITEIKLMNGFGFIEYKDAMDARDVVPAFRTFEALIPSGNPDTPYHGCPG